jgi:GT2 family glycosyltransferase
MSQSQIDVSVIMPVYNAVPFLKEAVESILRQTFSNFEFLIFDDGSTDGSREILKRYAARDRRIRLEQREHGGYTRLINEGIELSRGQFIARMDADDISEPTRLKRQLDFLLSHPEHAAVGSNFLLIDRSGWPLWYSNQAAEHEEIDRRHVDGRGGSVAHPSAMLRRSCLTSIGGYNVDMEPAEDLDLFLRLAETGKLANLPDRLLRYRMHDKNVSSQRQDEQRAKSLVALNQACQRRGLTLSTPEVQTEPAQPRWQTYHAWCDNALSAGFHATAWKYATLALWHNPCSFKTWRYELRLGRTTRRHMLAKLLSALTGQSRTPGRVRQDACT